MSEIEMTREQFGDYFEQHTGALKALIAERDSENERLRGLLEEVDVSVGKLRYAKSLLIRAADALEVYSAAPCFDLIVQLRKAAE